MGSTRNTLCSTESESFALVNGFTTDNLSDDLEDETETHKKSIVEKSVIGNLTQSHSIRQPTDERGNNISERFCCVNDVTHFDCSHIQTAGRRIIVCPSRTSNGTEICSCDSSNRSYDQLINQIQAQALDLKTLQQKLKDYTKSLRCVAFLTALLILITTVILAILIVESSRNKDGLEKDEITETVDERLSDRSIMADTCMSCENVMYITGGSAHLEYSVSDGQCCLQDAHAITEALIEKMRDTQTSLKSLPGNDTQPPSQNIEWPDPSKMGVRSSLHLNGAYNRKGRGKFTWVNEAAPTTLVLVDNREKIKVGTSANYFLYVKIRFKSTSNSTSSVGFDINREAYNGKSIYKVVAETNIVHFDGVSQEHDCRSERVLYFHKNDTIFINVKEDHLVAAASHVFGMFEI